MARRYYQNNEESIGDMLFKGGTAVAHIYQQQEALKNQNMAQALNMMSAIGHLPPNIRNSQDFLKGIDENIGRMTGGKLKLPKVDEQTVMDMIQSRGQETPVEGGMTPIGQGQPTPQVGQYAPFAEETVPVYGFGAKGLKQYGKIPKGAVMRPEKEDKPENVVLDRDTNQEVYRGKQKPSYAPRTIEQEVKLSEARKKAEQKYSTGRFTGPTGAYVSYLVATGHKPEGPDDTWTKDQLDFAKQETHFDKDWEASIHNEAVKEAVIDASSTTGYNRLSSEQKKALIVDKVDLYKSIRQVPGGGWGPKRGATEEKPAGKSLYQSKVEQAKKLYKGQDLELRLKALEDAARQLGDIE